MGRESGTKGTPFAIECECGPQAPATASEPPRVAAVGAGMTRTALTQRGSRRRGFSLVEMLIALAITSSLLTAVFVALDASFMAYQKTTEVASTHTIARLTMHRMMTLIRTGRDFGPYPSNVGVETLIESDFIEFYTGDDDQLMRLEYRPGEQALYLVRVDEFGNEEANLLLENVIQVDEMGNYITPFTLEYEQGTQLYRATIDLTLQPDDNMSVELDGENLDVLRLVASAMPRRNTYANNY